MLYAGFWNRSAPVPDQISPLAQHICALLPGRSIETALIDTKTRISLGLRIVDEGDLASVLLAGDVTGLRQARLNCADNAVKFTEAAHIELRARLREKAKGESLVRFEVFDADIATQLCESRYGAHVYLVFDNTIGRDARGR